MFHLSYIQKSTGEHYCFLIFHRGLVQGKRPDLNEMHGDFLYVEFDIKVVVCYRVIDFLY